jgi:hypothetical protein
LEVVPILFVFDHRMRIIPLIDKEAVLALKGRTASLINALQNNAAMRVLKLQALSLIFQ